MRNVCYPGFVWTRWVELALQLVGHNHMALTAAMTGFTITDLSSQSFGLHQPMYSIRPAGFTDILQIGMYLAVTIHATGLQPELFDQAGKPLIGFMTFRMGLFEPGIVTTRIDVE